jgi:hypothetical protein
MAVFLLLEKSLVLFGGGFAAAEKHYFKNYLPITSTIGFPIFPLGN